MSVRSSLPIVENDITTLISQTEALKASIQAFGINSPGTAAQALAFQASGQTLLLAIGKTTADVQGLGGRVPDADGRRILDRIEVFVPTVTATVDAIVAKKPTFDNLTIFGVVPTLASVLLLQLLRSIGAAAAALTSAGLQVAPSSLVAEATQQKALVDNSFNKAIAIYSS